MNAIVRSMCIVLDETHSLHVNRWICLLVREAFVEEIHRLTTPITHVRIYMCSLYTTTCICWMATSTCSMHVQRETWSRFYSMISQNCNGCNVQWDHLTSICSHVHIETRCINLEKIIAHSNNRLNQQCQHDNFYLWLNRHLKLIFVASFKCMMDIFRRVTYSRIVV
jgi:hypothetical protein